MRKLHFSYEMKIDYSVEVGRCNFTIKCLPQDNKRQKISNVQIKLFPETDYYFGKDGLLNTQIYGVNEMPHKEFLYRIEGDAETGFEPYEEESNPNLDMIFRHPYGLNVAGKNIKQYFEMFNTSKDVTDYERAVDFMHLLHEYLVYEPCSTNIDTSAEEAFSLGKGVCQDYAHIFIALMHLANIPARYVTGLIMGEGASHAWVEIFYNGKWYGLDPTNDKVVADEHIKIGIGRDARDCTINRGIMHGGGTHIQTIQVNVTERN